MYHVLPHLAIEGAPGEWIKTFELLVSRGVSRSDALKQIAFAYTGHPDGALPEEMYLVIERTERPDRQPAQGLFDPAALDSWLV